MVIASSVNQNNSVLEMNFRKLAMWSKRASDLEDKLRKREPKWDSASVGCYEATTDFGSRFFGNSPSDTNITIVATVNFSINAS